MTGTTGPTRRAGLRTALIAMATLPLLGTAGSSAARHESRTRGVLQPAPIPAPEPAPPPLEVMTFNLRYPGAKDSHTWPVRRPVMREVLRRAAPHVIGTQEGLAAQLRDIEADLGPHYDWIAKGRSLDDPEAVAVFYDTRRLAPVEHAHFWLSDTPEVLGSNTWGADYPRMVTWVRFRDLRTRQDFYLFNTHLDNASQYARVRSADLIAARLARIDRSLPLLLTGDFNAVAHDNPVYDRLLAAGLVDTWDTARARDGEYGTFTGYRSLVPGGDRIDWILATPGVTVRREWTDPFTLNGQYPSDHLPVQASVTLG